MSNRFVACLFLVLGALLPQATSARGEPEDSAPKALTRHVLGQGPASIALPSDWVVTRDADDVWLHARAPEVPGLAFLWSRLTPVAGEDLVTLAERHLAEERGATIRTAGFRVDDRVEGGLAGYPALWTLVAKPAASPPVRTLYVHLLFEGQGHALAAHVPLGSFHRRRAATRALLGTFRPGAETEDASLDRALERLNAAPPATGAEYQAWMSEFHALGEAGRPHLERLVEAYVAGPGAEDQVARRFLGHRLFEHPLPEELHFRGHAFVRLVEQANDHRWFAPTEGAALAAAETAWAATLAHAKTLREDHRARAAEQAFANYATTTDHAAHHLAFYGAPPYALIEVSAKPLAIADVPLLPDGPERDRLVEDAVARGTAVADGLRTLGRDLQAVYQLFLDRYGEANGLHDLAEPWGGGPQEQAYRSFAEGVPVTVVVAEKLATLVEMADLLQKGWMDVRTGRLLLATRDLQDVAGLASEQLLWWLARQRRMWRAPRLANAALSSGLAKWIGAVERVPDGTLRHTGEHDRLHADMVALRDHFRARGEPYPVFPLTVLLKTATRGQLIGWGQRTWGLPPRAILSLQAQQSWALARFLETYDGGRLRPALGQLVAAGLEGNTYGGSAEGIVQRAWAPNAHGDAGADLDIAFGLWVHEVLLAEAKPAEAEPEPRDD